MALQQGVPVPSRVRTARAERAMATRQRVVAAAAPLFVRDGYVETTMAGIARAAGVAVQTLYLSFGSKAAVLDAVLRAAAADPEPAELLDRARRAALAAHGQAVDELAEKPGFTARISLQRATEVVAALLSPETYGLLVVAQGWATPDWAEWVSA